MAEPVEKRRWLGCTTFVLLYAALVVASLLPLNTMPRNFVGPDLLVCITLVWVLRRPDLVPLPVIAGLFFVTDLLLQRPPGLLTALMVLMTEMLRRRSAAIRALPFLLEWAVAGVVLIGLTLANRLVLAAILTPQAPLGLSFMQMVMTMLAWPVVAMIARFGFGITRPAPGELDARGKPL